MCMIECSFVYFIAFSAVNKILYEILILRYIVDWTSAVRKDDTSNGNFYVRLDSQSLFFLLTKNSRFSFVDLGFETPENH